MRIFYMVCSMLFAYLAVTASSEIKSMGFFLGSWIAILCDEVSEMRREAKERNK